MEEISKHKSETDAWVVVDGVVYDITRFVDTHPGGVEVDLSSLAQLPIEIVMFGNVTSVGCYSFVQHNRIEPGAYPRCR